MTYSLWYGGRSACLIHTSLGARVSAHSLCSATFLIKVPRGAAFLCLGGKACSVSTFCSHQHGSGYSGIATSFQIVSCPFQKRSDSSPSGQTTGLLPLPLGLQAGFWPGLAAPPALLPGLARLLGIGLLGPLLLGPVPAGGRPAGWWTFSAVSAGAALS